MQVFFIEQALKCGLFKAIFNLIELEEDRIIIHKDCEKMNINKKIELVKKIKKCLQKNAVNTIIIEQGLKQNKELVDLLYSNNIKIIERKVSL